MGLRECARPAHRARDRARELAFPRWRERRVREFPQPRSLPGDLARRVFAAANRRETRCSSATGPSHRAATAAAARDPPRAVPEFRRAARRQNAARRPVRFRCSISWPRLSQGRRRPRSRALPWPKAYCLEHNEPWTRAVTQSGLLRQRPCPFGRRRKSHRQVPADFEPGSLVSGGGPRGRATQSRTLLMAGLHVVHEATKPRRARRENRERA